MGDKGIVAWAVLHVIARMIDHARDCPIAGLKWDSYYGIDKLEQGSPTAPCPSIWAPARVSGFQCVLRT